MPKSAGAGLGERIIDGRRAGAAGFRHLKTEHGPILQREVLRVGNFGRSPGRQG